VNYEEFLSVTFILSTVWAKTTMAGDIPNPYLLKGLYCGTAPKLNVVGTVQYNPSNKMVVLALNELLPSGGYFPRPPSLLVADETTEEKREVVFTGHVD
jgi:hypothetical protein